MTTKTNVKDWLLSVIDVTPSVAERLEAMNIDPRRSLVAIIDEIDEKWQRGELMRLEIKDLVVASTIGKKRDDNEIAFEREVFKSMDAAENRILSQLNPKRKSKMNTTPTSGPDPHKLFDNAAKDDGNLRVKPVKDRYCMTKSPGISRHTGKQEKLYNRIGTETLSQWEDAKAGAMIREIARKYGVPGVSMQDEHEQNVLGSCFEDSWAGDVAGYPDERTVYGEDAKSQFSQWSPGRLVPVWSRGSHLFSNSKATTILDDATSGGQYLIPEWFDQNVVTFPLLNGGLLPFVGLEEMPRGSTWETASVGNPSVTWNQSEGTAITLFTTDSLIAQITGSVFSTTLPT